MSSDGRYVAFTSSASNLISNDTNNCDDVFVYDRAAGTIERVSVGAGGVEGNSASRGPSISADGRYVAFHSYASNLVPGDTNNQVDVFVYDRTAGTTIRVSVSFNGAKENGHSYPSSISADGRYVAFSSYASNLVPGDSNGNMDAFVYDRDTGTTERVSVSSGMLQGNNESCCPSISADGRYVAFESYASNLVLNDNNKAEDIFVRDRDTNITERTSVNSGGTEEGNGYSFGPSISADGRYVAFESSASNLVSDDTNNKRDIFVYDRVAGTTERVSVGAGGVEGNSYSEHPSISANGRYVAFESYASNLVADDTNDRIDIFVYDRISSAMGRINSGNEMTEMGYNRPFPSISADGRYVAFNSDASNLVPNDTNNVWDVFVATDPLDTLT
ncbi:MAG: hypothetical protein B5M52_03630, partial [Helicobacteraceae bacterium 4484_230]